VDCTAKEAGTAAVVGTGVCCSDVPSRSRRLSLIFVALSSVVGAVLIGLRAQVITEPLPAQLSDAAYWQMIVDFSEPSGVFRSDNFVSNEKTFQEVIPELRKRATAEGVYLGVGPDQNFTYITSVSPRMAFIVDIRRQNLIQHLLYKALVEMCDTRGDFLSRLFSRPKPDGLDVSASALTLLDAYREVAAAEPLFVKNLKDVEQWLVERHKFQLTEEDLRSLAYVYEAFFSEGPELRYSYPRQRAARWFPTYAELMVATDADGVAHSYIANEQNYRALREFQKNNLLVPIVGDFAGDKAIRAVGKYVAAHGATVNYFYTSNVEQYLFQGDAWRRYYASVATLPLSEKSTFIRAYFDVGFLYPPGIITPDLHSVQLLNPIASLLGAVAAEKIASYADVIEQSK
jgi:hypothetical protein